MHTLSRLCDLVSIMRLDAINTDCKVDFVKELKPHAISTVTKIFSGCIQIGLLSDPIQNEFFRKEKKYELTGKKTLQTLLLNLSFSKEERERVLERGSEFSDTNTSNADASHTKNSCH